MSRRRVRFRPPPTVHLFLYMASSMGQGILAGFMAYRAEHHRTWRCGILWMTPEANVDALAVGPPTVDGLVGVVTEQMAAQWTPEQRRRVVNISRTYRPPAVTSVTTDDEAIGRVVGEYLLGKGLQQFVAFGLATQRQTAFAATVTGAGKRFLGSATSDQPRIKEWFAQLPSGTGIMAYNDVDAAAALQLAHDAGRSVPNELVVVGVDDDPVPNLLAPMPITSVDPDFRTIGYRAAGVLDDLLEGRAPPASPVRIPPLRVVERASSDFPAIADPHALTAARLIRARACQGLTVAQILEQIPLSRRPLERRFFKAFGRTMLTEIHARRLSEACRLLRTSDLPVAAIARRSGFRDPKRFTKVFTATVGRPPAAYRRSPDTAAPGD